MNDKQLVALEVAKFVKNGMLVGLGTGSTANYFIDELARLQRENGLSITTVASSTISAQDVYKRQVLIRAIMTPLTKYDALKIRTFHVSKTLATA